MTRAIWIFTAVNLTVIGISHIAAPMAWTHYFIWLREKGQAGVLIVAAMSLVFGAPIVAFHEVWSGWPLAVTLATRFSRPTVSIRTVAPPSPCATVLSAISAATPTPRPPKIKSFFFFMCSCESFPYRRGRPTAFSNMAMAR